MNYSRDLGRWSTATLLLIILFIVLIGSSVYGEAFRIVTVSTAGYAFSTANSDLIEVSCTILKPNRNTKPIF